MAKAMAAVRVAIFALSRVGDFSNDGVIEMGALHWAQKGTLRLFSKAWQDGEDSPAPVLKVKVVAVILVSADVVGSSPFVEYWQSTSID
jgi:hypothetical protein